MAADRREIDLLPPPAAGILIAAAGDMVRKGIDEFAIARPVWNL